MLQFVFVHFTLKLCFRQICNFVFKILVAVLRYSYASMLYVAELLY